MVRLVPFSSFSRTRCIELEPDQATHNVTGLEGELLPECHVINGQHHAVGKAQSKGKRKRSRRAVRAGGLKLHGEQPLVGILAAELLLGHEAELLALDDLTVHHPIAMGFADRGRTAQQAGARLCFLRQAGTCVSRCDKQEASE